MHWAPNWVGVSSGVAAPGTSITSIARYPQHLDVFCVGADNGFYSAWWDIATGWANWFQVSGDVAAPGTTITVVARNPDHPRETSYKTDRSRPELSMDLPRCVAHIT